MRKFLVLLILAFGFAFFLLSQEEFAGLETVDVGDLDALEGVALEVADVPPDEAGLPSRPSEVNPVTIEGRALRVDGVGVSGLRVRLEHPWVPEVSSVTDADGNFSLTPSEMKGELVPDSTTWVLVGGERNLTPSRKDGYQIVVAEPVSVRGQVVSADGSPVEGARIFGHPPTDAMVPLGISAIPLETEDQVAYTDRDGRFQVGPLPNVPRARIEVTRNGFAPASVPMPADPEREILVVLDLD